MRNDSMFILFFVKRSKVLKNGELPIYVRITVNGQRSEASIQRSITPNLWDNKKNKVSGKSKVAEEINYHLDNQRTKLYKIHREFEDNESVITSETILNEFLGQNKKNVTILELFKEHNDKCKKLESDFAAGTIQRYDTCLKHTQEFIRSKYKKEDLDIRLINERFVEDFEFFFKTNHPSGKDSLKKCSHNTTMKYLRNFKKITRIAVKRGLIKSDPFASKKLTIKDVKKEYLTEEELVVLASKKISIPRIEKVRDIFVFCCFTGLAFIDVKNLKDDDQIIGNSGHWLKIFREKTDNECNIPLMQPAKNLIEKYAIYPEVIKNGKAFPVPSNVKMNLYLKEIADICGIKKNLTTHCARHTFASTIGLANGLSLSYIAYILGHKTTKMTEVYAKVDKNRLYQAVDLISNKYLDML